MVSDMLQQTIKKAVILPDAKHSDHCPVITEIGY